MIGLLTFENPYINFGAQYEKSKDQIVSGGTIVDENGYSIRATPRLPDCGLEALIRWDRVTPDDTKAGRKTPGLWGPRTGSPSPRPASRPPSCSSSSKRDTWERPFRGRPTRATGFSRS